jgi:hypothetical protein
MAWRRGSPLGMAEFRHSQRRKARATDGHKVEHVMPALLMILANGIKLAPRGQARKDYHKQVVGWLREAVENAPEPVVRS